MESTTTQARTAIARPVLPPRASAGSTIGGTTPGTERAAAYVADTFTGDASMTSRGMLALAQDGEPAGLSRVTLAMRKESGHPAPAPRRLIGLSSWAAGIGVMGAIIAVWAGFTALLGAPAWFVPTATLLGLAGVGATMGAFVTAREPRTPWALLGCASLTLIIAIILLATA